jgi:undecaprenyl-phosphate 4-deoxy-4-formamido-L-arabinose transferase
MTLRKVVDGILEAASAPGVRAAVEAVEVLLVVDGSPDGTAAVARELADEHAEVRAVELRRNYGQHNALLAGIHRARHEVVVTMDDDLQHLPEEIPALLAPIADGEADLVYGVPEVEEHGVVRSAASRGVKRGLALAGVPRAQDVSSFRAFRTELREGFVGREDPYVSVDVLLSWTTTSVARVVIRMDHRTVGTSSYTLPALVRHAMNMITGYSNVPLRLVAWLGAVCAVCAVVGVVLGAVVVVKYFTGETTVASFTTIAAMVALFSGAQMLSLGIIGEYLGRLHTRSQGKPTYLVRSDTGGERSPTAG